MVGKDCTEMKRKIGWKCLAAVAASVALAVGLAVCSIVTPQAATTVLTPKASGETVYSGGGATIDASNSAEGYVMVQYSSTSKRVKFQMTGPNGIKYTYDLHPGGGFETFPLTSGSGSYSLGVFEQVQGTQYAQALAKTITVQLRSELLPYLYPSQYVNFHAGSQAVKKGEELATGASDELSVVQNVYNYVIQNVVYDQQKAATVTSGYLPNVDSTLSSGKGICFDYAALMASMLRSQNIPTRLEVGYVSGGLYHAWISIYLSETGWVNGIIRFDGQKWTLMDPTFAAGSANANITQFIGDGSGYSTKYVY